MKKWEYLFPEDFDDYCKKNKILATFTQSSNKLYHELGKRGWEICPLGNGYLFAKREVEEDSSVKKTTSSPSPDYWFAR